MSRKKSREKQRFSATQRKACVVLVCCILAVVATFFASWVLPNLLGLGGGGTSYDPTLYPVDTTLGSVLGQSSDAGSDYIAGAVFVGDQNTVALTSSNQITLDRYVGAADLKVSDIIRSACVYFVDDANAYTVPQALPRMKPRRVIVTIGSNDAAAGTTLEAYIQDYRQALQAIASAYSYCDIIVNSVPPVAKNSTDAAARQLLIDQYNQQMAALCDDAGYKFLNSAEVLKNTEGFAETSYFDAATGAYSGAGVNTLLSYVLSHAYTTEDRRPDTSDIPQRAAQPSGGATATPTPTATPTKHTATYTVEEGKGTLTGGGQSGVSTLTIEAADRESVAVTAVAAEGYSFYRWSDGLTDETRYDIVTQDLSVTAMFNDARVELTLDRSDTTINVGETVSVTATVRLGGRNYDNSGVQWSVNDELHANTGTFTYTPSAGGSYVIKAGIEINGTYQSASLTLTVNASATTLNITGPASISAGTATTLSASGQNLSGETMWTCDQQPGWQAIGSQVQFSAQTAGSYTIRANNNGTVAEFVLVVTDVVVAPTPTPSAEGGGEIII